MTFPTGQLIEDFRRVGNPWASISGPYARGPVTLGHLSSGQKAMVDNTANNAMSYYQLFYDDPAKGKVLTEAERFGPRRFVFTEQQMNRWSDVANGAAAPVASGQTIFVGGPSGILPNGSSYAPYRKVADGLESANSTGRDILMLRPGTYDEALTIRQRVTLRATRTGAATLRAP